VDGLSPAPRNDPADSTRLIRLAVLTSTQIRHRYFARALARRFEVVAVGYERIGYSPADTSAAGLTEDENRVVAEHFAERDRQERRFFGADGEWIIDSSRCSVRQVHANELNTERTALWLEDARAEIIAVFGTNLIRSPLIERFAGRMVNMHLGLSPYYRGTATNFYPLLNGEPEYVGATIHLIDPGIDSGPILAHARPTIVEGDQPHTIGCKAIQSGIDKLIAVLPEWRAGRRLPVAQWPVPRPRVYLRKHYHPRQVVELYDRWRMGLTTHCALRAGKAGDPPRLID
jgi:hypothetical protein